MGRTSPLGIAQAARSHRLQPLSSPFVSAQLSKLAPELLAFLGQYQKQQARGRASGWCVEMHSWLPRPLQGQQSLLVAKEKTM